MKAGLQMNRVMKLTLLCGLILMAGLPYRAALADEETHIGAPEKDRAALTKEIDEKVRSYTDLIKKIDGWSDTAVFSFEDGKFVTMFGGEHSVSIGAMQAYAKKYDDLTVVQIDAHADLRESYMGSACNHACALHWASKNTNLIQVGIRSMDTCELEHMDMRQTFFAHDIAADREDHWMNDVCSMLTDNVYITIDLDGFDPSIMPSTGTPEPGGLGWYQVLRLLRKIYRKANVVGFDIVELKPVDLDKSSDFLAAKLYYKLLAYSFDQGAQ